MLPESTDSLFKINLGKKLNSMENIREQRDIIEQIIHPTLQKATDDFRLLFQNIVGNKQYVIWQRQREIDKHFKERVPFQIQGLQQRGIPCPDVDESTLQKVSSCAQKRFAMKNEEEGRRLDRGGVERKVIKIAEEAHFPQLPVLLATADLLRPENEVRN